MSAHRLVGIAICMGFAMKMGDFETGWQQRLKVGKRQEASRAITFLSKFSAHRRIRWQYVEDSGACYLARRFMKMLRGK